MKKLVAATVVALLGCGLMAEASPAVARTTLTSSPNYQAASARAGGPVIQDVLAFDAPIVGKGGLQNTFVSCSDWRHEPRVVMRIRNPQTGWTRTYRWTGALPGLYNPRVAVGSYKVTTTASCAGVRRTRKQTVEVAEKTHETTISRAEFDAVRRGMTRDDVTAIVGYPGRDSFTYDGATSVTYDNMKFWAWSIIKYRDNRVIDKLWQVAHD